MSQNTRTRLFDDWAGRYDPAANERFPFLGYNNVLSSVVELAAVCAGQSVLDVGIGTGNLAAQFSEHRCDVWGVDFSSAMLERARELLPAATLVQADLTNDQFPPSLDRRFDRIVSAYTLHELDDESKLRLLKRFADSHLTDGGMIVVGDIAFPTAEVRETARNRWINLWDKDEFYWAADQMIPAAQRAGLAVRFVRISECAGTFVIRPL